MIYSTWLRFVWGGLAVAAVLAVLASHGHGGAPNTASDSSSPTTPTPPGCTTRVHQIVNRIASESNAATKREQIKPPGTRFSPDPPLKSDLAGLKQAMTGDPLASEFNGFADQTLTDQENGEDSQGPGAMQAQLTTEPCT